ncbi:MAG: hypothetical protein H7839_22480 [Magnetococcus sp. YQC-5]
MPATTKESKKTNNFLDLIFPQKNPLFALSSKEGRQGEEEVEPVITDPNKLKKILSHVMKGEGIAYFRRNERGELYHCQIRLDNENQFINFDETAHPKKISKGQTNSDEQKNPSLIVYDVVPAPKELQMQPKQNITIMFSFYGWHYRADVVVLSPEIDGWVLSYPERLTKIGQQRDCFRAIVNNTDTCVYVIREAGCYVADPAVHDVGIGGCSFMPSPDEANMAIGSKIKITLEWNDPPEERNTVNVEGIIKAKSGNGLYHVVFVGIGARTKEAMLLGNLVTFLQNVRLCQTSKGCAGCRPATCIKCQQLSKETE